MRQPGEPSVEEILDSIKQVMARDTRALLAGERPFPPDAAIGGQARENSPANDQADMLDLADMPRIPPAPPRPAGGDDAAPLLNDAASSRMRGSLDTLATLTLDPPPAASEPRGDEGALTAMVRELLRPALAAWLDARLPAMVERMVAAEIARIVGERR